MTAWTKNARVLDIYSRLCNGSVLNKFKIAKEYGVDERTVQRDIDDIRAYLDNCKVLTGREQRMVLYDRMKKGYFIDSAA